MMNVLQNQYQESVQAVTCTDSGSGGEGMGEMERHRDRSVSVCNTATHKQVLVLVARFSFSGQSRRLEYHKKLIKKKVQNKIGLFQEINQRSAVGITSSSVCTIIIIIYIRIGIGQKKTGVTPSDSIHLQLSSSPIPVGLPTRSFPDLIQKIIIKYLVSFFSANSSPPHSKMISVWLPR